MTKTDLQLSNEQVQFIEKLGLYYEGFGIPRIGGKILGLLLVANTPISAEQIAKTIKVSRGSVSTNVRFLFSCGFLENVPQPRDRTDYFTISQRAWSNAIQMRIEGLCNLKRILTQGLRAMGNDDEAKQKLAQMMDWAALMLDTHRDTLIKWETAIQ